MVKGSRFAGHRLVSFSPASKNTLVEISERLIPHEDEILDEWVSRQFEIWQPPGFSRADLRHVFGDIFHGVLQRMHARELELCITDLEASGRSLAEKRFPFDALIISVHFLEESYMPFLLNPPPSDPRTWLISMDEFLHVALAAIADAYFEAHRSELLGQVEVGRIVQESLLADIPKQAIDLDIAHIYISAHEIAQLGGDFLDWFDLNSGEVGFVVGDLSGHGLEAAADSVMLRSLFRGFMRESPNLPEAMVRLNRVLGAELKLGQFATALAGVYEHPGHLRLVNAGHPYPVLCDSECRFVMVEGTALAVTDVLNYKMVDVEMEPGSVFVVYTDGLVEARSGREVFGDGRMMSAIESMRDASPRAIVDQLVDEAIRFSGGQLKDDLAILVLKRRS